MDRGKCVYVASVIGTTFFLLLGGCGSTVNISSQDPDALHILDIYPRDGEKNVPTTVTAVVVFSDDVQFGTEGSDPAANANPQTVQLVKKNSTSNVPVDNFTVVPSSASGGSNINNTARIVLDQNKPLDAGAMYLIFVKSTVKGDKSLAIGVEIETSFTTSTGPL